MQDVSYAFGKTLEGTSLQEAISRVEGALKDRGFGILTRIDVHDTLKEKIDVDFKPYVILGACNPRLAHRALTTDDSVGLLLPCNVVVTEATDGAEVAFASPKSMLDLAGQAELLPVAEEAERLLREACDKL
ncbi:MAG: DUF302 domain-containing protein [Gemmatimonadota bacterium]|jgi:uncharacterized protein (DUF302 family)|nr:MAG: DUF302 domain-containing protein [Gemmatimonadota bacterium]